MINNIGTTYKGIQVKLDGNNFTNCVFEDCVLEFSGTGQINMEGCDFKNSKWLFSGPAQNTLQFLGNLYHGMGEGGKELVEATFENIRKNA